MSLQVMDFRNKRYGCELRVTILGRLKMMLAAFGL
jgi:hypothetical protein